MRGSRALFCAALCAAAPFSGAEATTYFTARQVGIATVSLRIDTDGTTGRLLETNILDWWIEADTGDGSFVLTGPLSGGNSFVNIIGNRFSATSEHLFFDFDAGPGFIVQFLRTVGAEQGYGFRTEVGNGPPQELLFLDGRSNVTSSPRSDFFIIASAASVPEPATWAMMITGFGAIGYSARRKTKMSYAPAA